MAILLHFPTELYLTQQKRMILVLNGGKTSDYQILHWDGGSVPGRMQSRYTFNGTALLDLKPLLIKASGAFTWSRQRGNDWTMTLSPVPERYYNGSLEYL